MSERWRDVVGWDGFYQVSDMGNVRTKQRTFMRPHSKTTRLVEYTYKAAPIKPWINTTTRYPMVTLNARGKKKKESVHRMVLFAFVGPPGPRQIACHWNGTPGDNRLQNLRWDSYEANVSDAVRHGRASLGEKNPMSKLTVSNVRSIRRKLANGGRPSIIGKEFGTTPEAISAIKHGKNWAWLDK